MVKIENLNFKYLGQERMFNNLQLELKPGNVYGLLGKNGAGKTSLIKIMCGLLFPHSGRCEVLTQIPRKRQSALLENIFFIPEEFYVPAVTATRYVKLYTPFYPNFDKDYFQHCLAEFDLPTNKVLTLLSYGQKKKFLIAFALATNCRLLLLDEPTNGLDIPSKGQFRKLVASAVDEEKTFIISTHQVRDVENLVDPIVILDDGKIIFNASLEEISQKLSFVTQTEKPNSNDILYSETTVGGYYVVKPNREKYETEVNMEMLFNAVVTNQDRIKSIFESGDSNHE